MVSDKSTTSELATVAEESPRSGSDPASRLSIKQIVVPTDLKPHGQQAISYALAIAQCFDATLTLVHIYDPAYTYAEAQEVIKSLEQLCSQLRKEHAASEFTVEVGVPYLQIPVIAKNLHADLMVISKHNYSWLERFIFGGDGERILRRTPCPVLVVDENERKVGSPA